MDGSGNSTSDAVTEHLAHFGVKGMKWGRRKAQAPASSESTAATAVRAKAKKGKTRALTNDELRVAIERMRLEQEFKRLTGNEKSQVGKFIAGTLLNVGKQQLGNYLAAQVPVVGGLAKGALKNTDFRTPRRRREDDEWYSATGIKPKGRGANRYPQDDLWRATTKG